MLVFRLPSIRRSATLSSPSSKEHAVNPVDIFRLLSLAAIWGASFLFMRIIAPVIGTIPTAFFRVSIAAAGLLVILGLMRISWDFKGKLKTVMLLGVINSGIPATLYSVAAQVLPAGYSAIFNATTPLMGVQEVSTVVCRRWAACSGRRCSCCRCSVTA
jgi:hypothetical protein